MFNSSNYIINEEKTWIDVVLLGKKNMDLKQSHKGCFSFVNLDGSKFQNVLAFYRHEKGGTAYPTGTTGKDAL